MTRVPELPASVRLALWTTVAWRGDLDVADVPVRALPDLDHVGGDLDRLALWRDLGERALFVALPRQGDLSRVPLGPVPATALAAQVGECVYVAGIGGLLVPTIGQFGPEGDTGWRIDWTAYDADPVARHRLEMLDLREVERRLLTSLRDHTARFEAIGGSPWSHAARAAAEADLDTTRMGLPPDTPPRALRVIGLAATAASLADRAGALTALGSNGLDVGTVGGRELLLRDLRNDAEDALTDAANVAVMALAGWRPV